MRKNIYAAACVTVFLFASIFVHPVSAQYSRGANSYGSGRSATQNRSSKPGTPAPGRSATQNRSTKPGTSNSQSRSVAPSNPPALTTQAVPKTPPPKNHALLIGINNYRQSEKGTLPPAGKCRHTLFSLQFCEADMEGLKEALIEGKFTTEENISLMTTSEPPDSVMYPTAEKVKEQLKNLAMKAGPNDTIFLAFAGHGIALSNLGNSSKPQQYLCMSDSELLYDLNEKKYITETLVSQTFIKGILESSKARSKVVVLDACRNVAQHDSQSRSAVLGDTDEKNLSRSFFSNEENKFDGTASLNSLAKGFYQLSSCDAGQESLEDGAELGHGVFSNFLIKGLKGMADNDRNGEITMFELYLWACDQTKEHAKTRLDKDQVPTLARDDKTTGDLVIAFCKPRIDEATRLKIENEKLQAERDQLEKDKRLLEEQKKRPQAQPSPAPRSGNGGNGGRSNYGGGRSGGGGQGSRMNKM